MFNTHANIILSDFSWGFSSISSSGQYGNCFPPIIPSPPLVRWFFPRLLCHPESPSLALCVARFWVPPAWIRQTSWGFPSSVSGKEPACQCRRHKRLRFHPWVGKRRWQPFQYSCLENPKDRGAWQATVYRVAKRRTRLRWLSTHTCPHLGPFLSPGPQA